MADSREIGMRVGAASNQAANVVAALVTGGWIQIDDITNQHIKFTEQFLANMQNLQAGLEGGVTQQFVATSIADIPVNVQAQAQAQAAQQVADAFPGTTTVAPAAAPTAASGNGVAGYNTTFSGSNKPLKLAEHPELDGWLIAQAMAVGVDQVWDNRGKPNYVQAINSGAAKTPPPFRSATEGIDKSFWPPKG